MMFLRFLRMHHPVIKKVKYDAHTGEVVSCLFCRIHSREEPARIAFENEHAVVFHTIAPASRVHLLVTPRKHVKNLKYLQGEEGAELVQSLMEVGKEALGSLGEDAALAQFCFHVPPYNSVDHLHMHVIADAGNMHWLASLKYNVNLWFCHSAEHVMQRLLKGSSYRSSK